jgi:hypothetical protein
MRRLLLIVGLLLAITPQGNAQDFLGNIPTNTILCRDTASAGQIETCTLSDGLGLSGANVITNILAGDVDGDGDTNDLDELAVEAELEAVLDINELQGEATAANLGADSVGASELNIGDAEAEIEGAIDTLANLTSIQGLTDTRADAGANAFFGWDDTAGAYENLTAAEAEAIVEPLIDTLANLSSAGGQAVAFADAGFDALWIWDDSASSYQNLALANLVAEATPGTGDKFLIIDSAGGLRGVDFDDMASGAGDNLGADADRGDITISGGAGAVATIDNDVVTYAKMQNVVNDERVLGRISGAAGDVEELTAAQTAQFMCGSDPNADRVYFWDDSAGGCGLLTLGNGFTISTTTVVVDSATQSVDGIVELATAAELQVGTDTARVGAVDQLWAANAIDSLTDAATITVDFSTFVNASVTLAGNRTLGNPSNEKAGQTGAILVTASTSTRTLALSSEWLPANGTEAFPISVTTTETVMITYWVQDSTHTWILGVFRRTT